MEFEDIDNAIKQLDQSDIDNIIEGEQPSEEELEDFKTKIKEWCRLEDAINKLNIAIKERRKHQNTLKGYIKNFMFTYNYNDVKINNMKITARKKEIVVPITVNEIKNKIIEYNNKSGDDLLNAIFDKTNRPKKEKEVLRRQLPKISDLSI